MNDDLYEGFDYSVKLGSVFTAIRGIDLPVDDFDLPVRIDNSLRRSGINNLQQILAMSGDELMTAIAGGERRKQETFLYLMIKLEELDTNSVPKWLKVYLEWSKEHKAHDYDEINWSITWVNNDISDRFQFDKEDIFMKELNQKLSGRYKEILGETAITAPFGKDGLSMPFLIKFADETAVETSDLRIMFFGQETREWTDIGTVDDVMESYCKDFNDFSGLPGSGTFWRVLSEMKEKINERLPGKHVSFIWNNIVKADYSPSAGYNGYKVPNEVYAKFRDVNRRLILSEIEIIKPDVLIFFTGAESSGYDTKIDDVFYHGTDVSTEKDPITVEGSKNILAVAHLPEILGRKYDAYVSYHTRRLENNPKAKDFVLDTIVEQCEKSITDTNK